jgi:hypothetical protein
MDISTPTRRATLIGFGSLLLGGCIVAPIEPRGHGRAAPPPRQDDFYEGDLVMQAPPPPRYEVVGLAPFVGAIWLAGFWAWTSGRWVWRPGYWGRPRAGYRWMPHAWIRVGPGWRLRPGRWAR